MTVTQNLYVEKYRPETLGDIIGHDTTVDRLDQFLNPEEGGGLPHCLFAGPAGTGKTAMAKAYANELYGDDVSQNFRDFNASDERGIDVVRDTIKEWCRRPPTGDYPFKIVFLDEADQLTRDAQPALRRTMENFSDTTRFVLSCNYSNQLIDPIQSRCATFYVSRLEDHEIRDVVTRVIEGEDIDVADEALTAIVRSADGDARRALNTLQTSTMDGEITVEMVESVTGIVDEDVIEAIADLALNGELDHAMARLDSEILSQGASPHEVINAMFGVVRKLDMPADARVKAIEMIADIDDRIQRGVNPHIHFHSLLGHLYMAQARSPIAQQQGGGN